MCLATLSSEILTECYAALTTFLTYSGMLDFSLFKISLLPSDFNISCYTGATISALKLLTSSSGGTTAHLCYLIIDKFPLESSSFEA